MVARNQSDTNTEMWSGSFSLFRELVRLQSKNVVFLGEEALPYLAKNFENTADVVLRLKVGTNGALGVDRQNDWKDGDFWRSQHNHTNYLENAEAVVFSTTFAEIPSYALNFLRTRRCRHLFYLRNGSWKRITLKHDASSTSLLNSLLALPILKLRISYEFALLRLYRLIIWLRAAVARRVLRRLAVDLGGGFLPDAGHAYKAHIPHLKAFADLPGEMRSTLLLFEDETLLHAVDTHEKVRKLGRGRYVHWELDLYFSSTDNSDPLSNPKHFRYIHRPRLMKWLSLFGIKPHFLFRYSALEYDTEPPFSSLREMLFHRNVASSMKKLMRSATPRATPLPGPKPSGVSLLIGSLGPGGAERQLCYLSAKLRERGYSARVFSYSNPVPEDRHYCEQLENDGVPCDFINSPHPDVRLETFMHARGLDDLALIHAIPATFQDHIWNLYTHLTVHRPAVLHCFLDHPNIVGAVAGWLAGVPRIILSMRNVNPSNFPYFNQAWFREWYGVVAESPRVVLTSNSWFGAKDYAQWMNISADRFTVIQNGLDIERFERIVPERVTNFRKELGLTADTPALAGVFRLAPEKQPLVFLKVVAKVRETFPKLKVFIAGIGQMQEMVEQEILRLKLDGCVHLLGRRSDVDLLFAAVDFVLLTSKVEGTPNVLMEAQALGKAAVCTEAGDVSKVVQHGKSGFIRGYNDINGLAADCVTLLDDPELRRKFGAAGSTWIREQLTVERMVDRTLECYGLDRSVEQRMLHSQGGAVATPFKVPMEKVVHE